MITPFFKNIHTLSIKFTKGTRNYKDVTKLLRDQLGITKDELLAVGFAGRDSVHVRFREEEKYENISDRYAGKQIDLDPQTTITVIDISKYKIKVSMKNVPFSVHSAATISYFFSDNGSFGSKAFLLYFFVLISNLQSDLKNICRVLLYCFQIFKQWINLVKNNIFSHKNSCQRCFLL